MRFVRAESGILPSVFLSNLLIRFPSVDQRPAIKKKSVRRQYNSTEICRNGEKFGLKFVVLERKLTEECVCLGKLLKLSPKRMTSL